MKRAAFTLIELLVGVIVVGVVMSAILAAFISLWKSQGAAAGMADTQLNAQQMVSTVANAFRGATLCASTDTGCTVGANAQDASSSSCTIYSRDSSNNLVKTTYAVTNGNYQVTVGTGTPKVFFGNATLTLTYYTSANYYTTSMTTFTPTNSTISSLIAVGITGTVTQFESSGRTASSTYSTLVSLANR